MITGLTGTPLSSRCLWNQRRSSSVSTSNEQADFGPLLRDDCRLLLLHAVRDLIERKHFAVATLEEVLALVLDPVRRLGLDELEPEHIAVEPKTSVHVLAHEDDVIDAADPPGGLPFRNNELLIWLDFGGAHRSPLPRSLRMFRSSALHIDRSVLHRHSVRADAMVLRVGQTAPRDKIELEAVPGTAQNAIVAQSQYAAFVDHRLFHGPSPRKPDVEVRTFVTKRMDIPVGCPHDDHLDIADRDRSHVSGLELCEWEQLVNHAVARLRRRGYVSSAFL
jgi:hypothetical protein